VKIADGFEKYAVTEKFTKWKIFFDFLIPLMV
jgi:hypothetical protein